MTCKLCGSKGCKNLHKTVRGSEKAHVYYCESCDYAFLVDIDIDASFYEQEFDTFMAERAGDASWENSNEHFEQRMTDARQRVQQLKEWVDFAKIGSVLELGSSSGFLLKALEEEYLHLKLSGIEPSERHRQYANKIGLNTHSSLEALDHQTFDLILSYFVLEHILEPKEWIGELKKYANNNAYFIAIVPNLNEALVKVYEDKNYDKFVWQLPHVSYFSETSLKLLLDSTLGNSDIHHLQRYTLSNHLNWLSGIKPKKSIEYPHITSATNLEYKQSMEQHKIGDTLAGVTNIVF